MKYLILKPHTKRKFKDSKCLNLNENNQGNPQFWNLEQLFNSKFGISEKSKDYPVFIQVAYKTDNIYKYGKVEKRYLLNRKNQYDREE